VGVPCGRAHAETLTLLLITALVETNAVLSLVLRSLRANRLSAMYLRRAERAHAAMDGMQTRPRTTVGG
jgi:hypothetical protein